MAGFILDENIRGNTLNLLMSAMDDVLSIYQTRRGISDEEVMQLAVEENRILVTLDKTDFGALIFQALLPPPPAVILFRLTSIATADIARFILDNVTSRSDWEGYFWVVEENGIRSRPLPT